MADISKVKLPNGTEYDIKDASARASYAALASAVASISVPTNVSAFTNDAGYITINDLPIYDGRVV